MHILNGIATKYYVLWRMKIFPSFSIRLNNLKSNMLTKFKLTSENLQLNEFVTKINGINCSQSYASSFCEKCYNLHKVDLHNWMWILKMFFKSLNEVQIFCHFISEIWDFITMWWSLIIRRIKHGCLRTK